jgi:hypothetical protein
MIKVKGSSTFKIIISTLTLSYVLDLYGALTGALLVYIDETLLLACAGILSAR